MGKSMESVFDHLFRQDYFPKIKWRNYDLPSWIGLWAADNGLLISRWFFPKEPFQYYEDHQKVTNQASIRSHFQKIMFTFLFQILYFTFLGPKLNQSYFTHALLLPGKKALWSNCQCQSHQKHFITSFENAPPHQKRKKVLLKIKVFFLLKIS